MSAWIFQRLWNPWQRLLPLCGSSFFFLKAQTNSTHPLQAAQIFHEMWGSSSGQWRDSFLSRNTEVPSSTAPLMFSPAFLGPRHKCSFTGKPRTTVLIPAAAAPLGKHQSRTRWGNLIPPAYPRSFQGSQLSSQGLVLRGHLPTSGAKSTRQQAPMDRCMYLLQPNSAWSSGLWPQLTLATTASSTMSFSISGYCDDWEAMQKYRVINYHIPFSLIIINSMWHEGNQPRINCTF